MTRGKDICKELKAVRKRIAEENDIALEIPECTYQGPCRGTCPRCESEVRYLENALAHRIRVGKVATVAGLALGLAVSNGVKAQSVTPTPAPSREGAADAGSVEQCCGTLKGCVHDLKTDELLPFCKVSLRQGDSVVACGVTDLDGVYTLKKIPFGDYTLSIQTVLYAPFEQGITITKQGFTVMDVSLLTTDMMGMPMIETGLPITTIEAPTAPPTPIRAYGKSVEEVARQVELEKMRAVMGEVQVHLPGIEASLAGDPPPIPKHVWSLDEKKLVGGLGYNEVDGPPTIRVVREGPLLIVDESDEPQF